MCSTGIFENEYDVVAGIKQTKAKFSIPVVTAFSVPSGLFLLVLSVVLR